MSDDPCPASSAGRAARPFGSGRHRRARSAASHAKDPADVFDVSSGGAILRQHLLWFFGHHETGIAAILFFGIATKIVAVFSRSGCPPAKEGSPPPWGSRACR
jgi:hypothetical protein